MAQVATNPKIEELRAKLKADPKSRLFYQLGEELRRAGLAGEAEQALRTGLAAYPTYLAAWVSLGRACREQKKDHDAVEALKRAMQLDPENVVAARLLADSYLELGEKVEAIKKYKFVHAVLPADEELEGIIARLDRELNAPAVASLPLSDESEQTLELSHEREPAFEAEEVPAASSSQQAPLPEPPADYFATEGAAPPREFDGSPFAASEEAVPSAPETEESPFDKTQPPFSMDREPDAVETGDAEPMRVAHEESPFEEPAEGFTSASVEIEQPAGFSIEPAPLSADVAAPLTDVLAPAGETVEEADVFAPDSADEAWLTAMNSPAPAAEEGYVETSTVDAPLPSLLGGIEPSASAAAPQAPQPQAVPAKVARLEQWLARVGKKGGADV